MRNRLIVVLGLVLALVLAGCGGGGSSDTGAGAADSTSSSASPSMSGSDAAATDCPTENTRSFAKTRFVADVGGSLFLLNRYLLKPYRAGAFTKGAQGRTKALIKAGLAAAATAKLVSNARENAKANPTLCKTVAGPLGQLASSLNGVVDGLKSGSLDAGAIGGISGLLGSLQQKSGQAGVPVQEQPVPLR
jgi:hypothetical protein